MNTKERIEAEALQMFSVRGYSGVSIRDIAGAVGIKESSIYKHYKGKEDIFETIVRHYKEKTEKIFESPSGDPGEFAAMSKEMLLAMMKKTFQLFARDEYISKCRKLFMISAPGDETIGRLYAGSFITEPVAMNTFIFNKLLMTSMPAQKEISKETPEAAAEAENKKLFEAAEAMAYQFYSPVFLILQEYDYGITDMKEALLRIERITQRFMEVYGL